MGTSKNLFRSEILTPSSETRKMSRKPGGVAGSYIDGFSAKSDEVAAEGAKLQPKEVFRGAQMQTYLKQHIRDVPDFPKPGIVFKDITPLLQNHKAFAGIIRNFAERYETKGIDTVVGIESRGFLFGAPLAHQLGAAFVPVRKKGKLPYKTVNVSYDLEYGSATIEMHTDAIKKGQKVVVVDDLLATGGTADATCKLIEKQGGKVVECAFVVELSFLGGREKIKTAPVYSLVSYESMTAH